MTANQNTAALHQAVADAISATGFHAMARDYLDRPEMRGRIVAAMTRNIRSDRKLGADVADRFARLAAQAGR